MRLYLKNRCYFVARLFQKVLKTVLISASWYINVPESSSVNTGSALNVNINIFVNKFLMLLR